MIFDPSTPPCGLNGEATVEYKMRFDPTNLRPGFETFAIFKVVYHSNRDVEVWPPTQNSVHI